MMRREITPEEWKEIEKQIEEHFGGECDNNCCECPFIVECSE